MFENAVLILTVFIYLKSLTFTQHAKKDLITYFFLAGLPVVENIPEHRRKPRQLCISFIKNFIYSTACIIDP